MSDSTQEAARLRAELSAANDAALRFTASAAQMQSAYTYALSRMNSALSQLSGAFRGLAAVGMNAFSGLISAVTPAIQTLSNLAVKLFGGHGLAVWDKGGKRHRLRHQLGGQGGQIGGQRPAGPVRF